MESHLCKGGKMNCTKCKKEITKKTLVVQHGYKRKICKICSDKTTREWNDKKTQRLKMWRSFYS